MTHEEQRDTDRQDRQGDVQASQVLVLVLAKVLLSHKEALTHEFACRKSDILVRQPVQLIWEMSHDEHGERQASHMEFMETYPDEHENRQDPLLKSE